MRIGSLTAERDALKAEVEGLKDAVRSARQDEAHCWARRVENLSAQLRETDSRYMALLKSVADGVAMQPRTVVLYADRTINAARAGDGK